MSPFVHKLQESCTIQSTFSENPFLFFVIGNLLHKYSRNFVLEEESRCTVVIGSLRHMLDYWCAKEVSYIL